MALTAALQIGLSNPKYSLPLVNQAKVKVEESYLTKPLLSETQITIEEKPKPKIYHESSGVTIIGYSDEQCVTFAKRMAGITRPLGYAGSIPSQGDEPQVGAIALESSIGHAMFVEEIYANGIVVSEANYWPGFVTRRFVPFSNVRGYLYS